ncbi:MAG: hypothetical protein K6E75_06415 [Lachnospiraceae bacterium]|nr:hypothetical protein [Lachnospiraceae bacterium]
MPQMERNVDLEKIDSDTLFGIEALRYQRLGQKVLFYGCLLAGVGANTLMPHFLHTPGIINVLAFAFFLMIGIAGGCNYSQEMTYGRYLMSVLFEEKKILSYRSGEDIRFLKETEVGSNGQKAEGAKQIQKQDAGERKRMLAAFIVMILVLVIVLTGIYAGARQKEISNIHHEIERSEDE